MKERSKAMNKNKRRISVPIIESIFGLLVLAIIGMVIYTVLFGSSNNFDTNILAILVGTISLMLSASILIPKFTLKNEVNNCIYDHYNEITNDVEKMLNEKLNEDFIHKTELYRLDAHLSRMIGFLLVSQDSIWAIGWLFRSLKRYIRLPVDDINSYLDFVQFINREIEKSKFNLSNKIVIDLNLGTQGKISIDKCQEVFERIIFDNAPVEKDEIRRVIRAIKDIIDFIYYTEIQERIKIPNINNRLLNELRKEEVNNINILKLLLLLLFLNKKELMSAEKIADEIYKISDYKKNKEIDMKNFFYNDIIVFFKSIENKKNKLDCLERIIRFQNERDEVSLFNDSLNKKEIERYKDITLK